MRHKIEYGLIGLFILILRMLPMPLGVRVGSLVGTLLYRIDRKHRHLTLHHLQRALGRHKERRALKQIAREVYRNMGKSLAESVYLPNQTASKMRKWTQVTGLQHYQEAMEQKKGVIILTAHLGNWEMIPKIFWAHGFRMHAVVRPLDNPYLNRRVYAWRVKNGMGVLNKRTDVGQILKLLRSGETVGFLLDQNTVEKDAVFVDFFGLPAATHKGVALLALRSHATVLPIFMIREPNGHRMIIEKPLSLPCEGSYDDNVVGATALFTKTIESYVARYPEQWLWLHRRWKTQETPVERVEKSLLPLGEG